VTDNLDENKSDTSTAQSGWTIFDAGVKAFQLQRLQAQMKEKELLEALKAEARHRAWLLAGGVAGFTFSFMIWFISMFAPNALANVFENPVALYAIPIMAVSMGLILKVAIESKREMSLREVDDISISKKKSAKREVNKHLNLAAENASADPALELQNLDVATPLNTKSPIENAPGHPASIDTLKPPMDSFELYVREVIGSLDAQVEWMERKGSNLLDRGNASLRNGILFYVLSIVVWQLYAWAAKGVTDIMIYGIASCSLAFIVMEFSAAWFLREYRSYVAASSHLEKVKSLYNRYLLSYLGIKAFASDDGPGLAKMRSELLKALAQDVSWPEAGKGKANDFNHMIEMFESLSIFAGKARGLIGPTPRKKTKPDTGAVE
jgi:hypothetical protein